MPSKPKQLPNGRWFVVVQYHGRRRRVHGRTRAEAVRRAGHALVELGGTPDLASVTAGELVADYIDDRARRCSPTWLDEAVRAMERLPDEFAARIAVTVNGAVLNALYHQLAADGYAPSAVHRVHEVVTAAYRRAERLGLVDRAPLAQPPPVPDRDVHPHTHDQARAILAAAATPLERIALRVAATIGGRRGETVAVRWDDLDLATGTLHVRRSLVVTRRAGMVERATKTGWKGHRHVALAPTLVAELGEWRTRQAERAAAFDIVPVWVFSDNAGVTPWRPDRLTHIYTAARVRAGVPVGVRLQDLRHYVATTMLADGVPVARVAQQLGHTSTATTERVYAHWIKPDEQARADVERRAQRLD